MRCARTGTLLTYEQVFSRAIGRFAADFPDFASGIPVALRRGILTVFDRPALGIANTDSFLTGNVGGGVKWYAPNGRWGVRGDYRFIALRGKDTGAA
jgi:hypothetical protein